VIGRAAHVELLCSPTYIPIFTWCLLTPDMFGPPQRPEREDKIEIHILSDLMVMMVVVSLCGREREREREGGGGGGGGNQ